MQIKIDKEGFVYIKRGNIWRQQICYQNSSMHYSLGFSWLLRHCKDACPLFNENDLSLYRDGKWTVMIDFRCAGSPHPCDDLIEDERIGKKKLCSKQILNYERRC